MKINVISRKLVKPCSPTPQNLNKYKISFRDELQLPTNISVLLFYPTKPKRIVDSLEESLAKILVQFYPLAGRYIKKDHLVDCSDEGAEFVEAEALDVEMIHLTAERTTDKLNGLLPRQFYEADEATDPLLSIQITQFKCGGLVIGISIPHRIFDASSLGTFVAAWSSASNPGPAGQKITISPTFDSSLLFPGKNVDFKPPRAEDANIVVKKFSFNKEAIMSLKSKLRQKDGSKGRVISKVRVVSALIAKALIGLDRAKYGKSRPFLILQPVNIRQRTVPPLSKHSCGNLALILPNQCMAATQSNNIGIQELVDLMGDAVDKTIADCAATLSPGRDGCDVIYRAFEYLSEKVFSGKVNVMVCSDCTKFGFYAADFGWGKPVWATIGTGPGQNLILFMNNKEGDGIEAWVHLNPNDMHYFEQDEDIKLFTTFPGVIPSDRFVSRL